MLKRKVDTRSCNFCDSSDVCQCDKTCWVSKCKIRTCTIVSDLTCQRSLSLSPLRLTDDKPPKEDEASSYIKDNPELEKILRDLYDDKDRDQLVGAMQTKFNLFKDDDSPVIYDVDEERERMMERRILGTEEEQEDDKRPDKYSKYDTSRKLNLI